MAVRNPVIPKHVFLGYFSSFSWSRSFVSNAHLARNRLLISEFFLTYSVWRKIYSLENRTKMLFKFNLVFVIFTENAWLSLFNTLLSNWSDSFASFVLPMFILLSTVGRLYYELILGLFFLSKRIYVVFEQITNLVTFSKLFRLKFFNCLLDRWLFDNLINKSILVELLLFLNILVKISFLLKVVICHVEKYFTLALKIFKSLLIVSLFPTPSIKNRKRSRSWHFLFFWYLLRLRRF